MISVSCFGVRFSVMFHFMFVHYTFMGVLTLCLPSSISCKRRQLKRTSITYPCNPSCQEKLNSKTRVCKFRYVGYRSDIYV